MPRTIEVTESELKIKTPKISRKRALPPPRMQLNLTAMIDVIFLLLVYFVVTATFAVGEGVITAKLPRGGSRPTTVKPPQRPLKVLLSSAGTSGVSISIEGVQRATSFTELISLFESLQYDPKLLRNGAFKPDNPVIIKPDGKVRWQHVVNGFNAAIAARYTNVNFAQIEN